MSRFLGRQRDPLYLEVFQGQPRDFEGPYTNAGFNLGATWSVWFVDATGTRLSNIRRLLSRHAPEPCSSRRVPGSIRNQSRPVTNTPSTGAATPSNPQSVLIQLPSASSMRCV